MNPSVLYITSKLSNDNIPVFLSLSDTLISFVYLEGESYIRCLVRTATRQKDSYIVNISSRSKKQITLYTDEFDILFCINIEDNLIWRIPIQDLPQKASISLRRYDHYLFKSKKVITQIERPKLERPDKNQTQVREFTKDEIMIDTGNVSPESSESDELNRLKNILNIGDKE